MVHGEVFFPSFLKFLFGGVAIGGALHVFVIVFEILDTRMANGVKAVCHCAC